MKFPPQNRREGLGGSPWLLSVQFWPLVLCLRFPVCTPRRCPGPLGRDKGALSCISLLQPKSPMSSALHAEDDFTCLLVLFLCFKALAVSTFENPLP